MSIAKDRIVDYLALAKIKALDLSNSTIVGSLVIKGKVQINNCSITRGPLPLVLSHAIDFEPFIIPGTWLEY